MAINASGFFKHYRAETIGLFMLINILSAVTTGALAYLLWQYGYFDGLTSFVLCLVFLVLAQILIAPLLVAIASKPLKILAQAIAHVSKDPVHTPPPSITKKSYEHSGLKALVQTVYELAASPSSIPMPEQTSTLPSDLYKDLLNTIPCGIIALNASGEVVFTNDQAPIHQTPDGKQQIDLLFEQSEGLEKWLQACQDKVRDTKLWHRVADRIPGEEDRHIFDVIGYYSKDGKQGIEVILLTIDRTSDYAPQDEEMDFIALAAHELRGPITVIRGYLDLLDQELESKLENEQEVLIDRLQVSAERLSGYINTILNVSRYDRNHLNLHLHEERLIDIIQALVPDLALRAKTQNRRLTFHIPEDLPTIAADRSSLSEVLSNLIDNGIKYSRDGGEVIISASIKGNFVEVTVQDFGIGMPASIVGNLFNKFYRSHRSSQQVSGTGLGLYLCKAVVELHGGSIWVRSTEGQGSTFGFTLPIYSTIADKLAKGDNSNGQIIERADGWIKNHAMYRR